MSSSDSIQEWGDKPPVIGEKPELFPELRKNSSAIVEPPKWLVPVVVSLYLLVAIQFGASCYVWNSLRAAASAPVRLLPVEKQRHWNDGPYKVHIIRDAQTGKIAAEVFLQKQQGEDHLDKKWGSLPFTFGGVTADGPALNTKRSLASAVYSPFTGVGYPIKIYHLMDGKKLVSTSEVPIGY